MEDLHRLRLVASAIAGRPVDLAAGEAGGPAWTDGTTIFVDPAADAAALMPAIAAQASLLAAGSLDPDHVRPLLRRAPLADRYLAVEVHRALAATESVLPPAARRRIDPAIAAGLTAPADSLERARERRDLVPRADLGTIRPKALLLAAERADVHGVAAAQPPAAREVQADDLEALVDDVVDETDLGQMLTSPVGGGGPIGRLLQRLVAPIRSRDGGGPPGADAPTHRGVMRPGAGRRTVVGAASGELAAVSSDAGGTGSTYPEWDVHQRRYRADWCTVREVEPPVRGPGPPVVRSDAAALRRALARLGIGLDRCRRQPAGDDIDIDAAVEARVDALAGVSHDDAAYVASLRRRRDLGVLVLLDVSGSAGEPGTAGRSVHAHQVAAALGLTVALHELGDRVALYGFSSRGREAVDLVRVKAFDDHLDGGVDQRLAALRPGAYTRLGAAIRHGAAVLDERSGTPRRLLLVLSDGFAYDHGYESTYGQADARRALLEARRRGIGCLCLSVGTTVDPEALRRVFGTAAHATLPRPDELPRHIGPLFRRALRSAEAQHRAFQRTERTRERLAIERRTDGHDPAPLLRAGR